jgi:hypothetical protein
VEVNNNGVNAALCFFKRFSNSDFFPSVARPRFFSSPFRSFTVGIVKKSDEAFSESLVVAPEC